MFEIKGKFATAVCYASVCEDQAVQQIKTMCDMPFADGSRIRIMPDVHAGTGCTIGTTMTITDKAVPNIVGVDIGWGMYTVELNEKEIDLPKLDAVVHQIPCGMNVWDKPQKPFPLGTLCCYKELHDVDRLACSLGTLGGGNHFIEIDRAMNGDLFLVIHSGSRNLGKQVAEIYQKKAISLHGAKAVRNMDISSVIQDLKAQGRQSEIEETIKRIKADAYKSAIPDDLCWVDGQAFSDYLFDMDVCQTFAVKSRELMASYILEHAGLTAKSAFHTIHNYIDINDRIIRKGAISAKDGELLLIPINMRDGSIFGVGRGNPEWNFSAPHGAGRIMSRNAARANISMDDFSQAMQGIYTTTAVPETIDEAPMAYKGLNDILDNIRDTVDVLCILKPIYNFKAAE